MADNEEGDGTAPGGNEWEVLTLTASAYAAAPGPRQVDSVHDSQGKLEAEASNDMVYSRHFIFPPSQHENLPLEPEYSESKDEKGGDTDASELIEKEEGKLDVKGEDNASIRDFLSDDLSASGADFDRDVHKEKSNSSSTGFLTSEHETTMGRTNTDEDNGETGLLDSQKPVKGGKYDGSDLPCEAWWKRRAVGLYAQAKETNTLWSIFIAAAVMGLVIIGHQWQARKVASFAPRVAVRYQ